MIPLSLAPPSCTPADRFAGIIAMLVRMLGDRLERPGKPGLAGPLTAAIHLRLQRIRNRISRYVARYRAGTLTPPRPRTRPGTPRPRKAAPGPWDHLPKLPRGRLWLVKLVPGIGVGANHLRILLDDPEMQAMLQMAPQIGRTLRPYWHMLSKQPLPPILQRGNPPAGSMAVRPPPLRQPASGTQRPPRVGAVSPERPQASPPRPAPDASGPADAPLFPA